MIDTDSLILLRFRELSANLASHQTEAAMLETDKVFTGSIPENYDPNMLVVRGNGSFVTASGDEILNPPRRGIQSWSTRAGDRLFGAQKASTGGGRSGSPRG
jgi:hypothetical protein